MNAVVFDLGGVVLGWDPALAYTDHVAADAIDAFLARIDFRAWNRANDAGRSFAEAEAELIRRFPEDADAIAAYRLNFARTLTGQIPGTGALIAELQRAGVRLVALTNWSAESFRHAEERFGILRRFEGIVVSGAERLAKPDPAIFALTCDRYGLDPAATVFVDDIRRNVAAADSAGLTGVRFENAAQLRDRLVELGLLGPRLEVEPPVHHLAVAADWARPEYPWSTRGVTYDAEGYVHCSYPHQVAGVRERYYGDLADDELVLLELDVAAARELLVGEDLGPGEPFPHLYAPLTPELVRPVSS